MDDVISGSAIAQLAILQERWTSGYFSVQDTFSRAATVYLSRGGSLLLVATLEFILASEIFLVPTVAFVRHCFKRAL